MVLYLIFSGWWKHNLVLLVITGFWNFPHSFFILHNIKNIFTFLVFSVLFMPESWFFVCSHCPRESPQELLGSLRLDTLRSRNSPLLSSLLFSSLHVCGMPSPSRIFYCNEFFSHILLRNSLLFSFKDSRKILQSRFNCNLTFGKDSRKYLKKGFWCQYI